MPCKSAKNDVCASSVRFYEDARDLAKRWKTGRMSALTLYGNRPVSVMVVYPSRCLARLRMIDVSGMDMDMTGSSRVDGVRKDGRIRIGRSERARPRVMSVRELGASTRMSEYRVVV